MPNKQKKQNKIAGKRHKQKGLKKVGVFGQFESCLSRVICYQQERAIHQKGEWDDSSVKMNVLLVIGWVPTDGTMCEAPE